MHQCSGGWNWVSSLWSAMECPVVSSEMDLWVWFTLSRLYIDAQGYVPTLLENLRGMSCSGTYWLLGRDSFQCRYGGLWVISYELMFSVVRSSLVFSGLGLKPLASEFQSYSSHSINTSLSIQH